LIEEERIKMKFITLTERRGIKQV